MTVTHHPPADRRLDPDPTTFRLRGVTKSWADLLVLDDVDLDLPEGTVTSLFGGNGAGKTTLLRIAAGMIVPDSGTVDLGGNGPDRNRREFHRRLGFLSAGDRGLYARLSVKQNLDLIASLALLNRRHRPKAVAAAIARFELGDLARRRVDRLSMGQRQRVRLAETFVHSPTVVLLDEPRTSLDDDGKEILAAAVADAARDGAAILWCAPTGEQPAMPADRAFVLQAGKLHPA